MLSVRFPSWMTFSIRLWPERVVYRSWDAWFRAILSIHWKKYKEERKIVGLELDECCLLIAVLASLIVGCLPGYLLFGTPDHATNNIKERNPRDDALLIDVVACHCGCAIQLWDSAAILLLKMKLCPLYRGRKHCILSIFKIGLATSLSEDGRSLGAQRKVGSQNGSLNGDVADLNERQLRQY
jgi:hypothetical protein